MSDEAVDLISQMLKYNKDKRITAQQCLMHPYFSALDSAPSLTNMSPPRFRNISQTSNNTAVPKFNPEFNLASSSPYAPSVNKSSFMQNEEFRESQKSKIGSYIMN